MTTQREVYDRIRNAWPGPVADCDLTDDERAIARERKGLVETLENFYSAPDADGWSVGTPRRVRHTAATLRREG